MDRNEASAKPTIVAGKQFKCSQCGDNRLEEVMTDVTQSSSIAVVDVGGEADYDGTSSDGGEVDRIQCMNCGQVIARDYRELGKLAKKWK